MPRLYLRQNLMFRTHFLLPHEVVGAITPDHDLPKNVSYHGGAYSYEGKPFLHVAAVRRHMSILTYKITAIRPVWLQEPGLTQHFYNFDGYIQGYHGNGAVTEKYPMKHRDAHKSTVHFSRYRVDKNFVDEIKVKRHNEKHATYWKSDDGFWSLLDDRLEIQDEWVGCSVFGTDYKLAGTAIGHEMIRRWEAAAAEPATLKLHFIWTGGAAAVTNEHGHDVGLPGNVFLWQPRSWKLLHKEQTIEQTITYR